MLWVLTLIRVLAPWTIFVSPLPGIVTTLLADTWDWRFFPFGELSYPFYQRWDKVLDLYGSTIFLAYLLVRWKDARAKWTAIALLLIRGAGVVLFELTGLKLILFFFPNVFDSFFFVAEADRVFFGSHRVKIFASGLTLARVLALLVWLKLMQEYLIYVTGTFPWQQAYGQFTPNDMTNQVIWLGLFILLHVGVWWLKERRYV